MLFLSAKPLYYFFFQINFFSIASTVKRDMGDQKNEQSFGGCVSVRYTALSDSPQ